MLREGSKSSAAWLPPRDWRRIWSLIRRQWQQRPSRERRGKEEEEGWEGFRQRQTFKRKSNEKYCLLLPRPALIPSRSIATLYPDLPCLCFSLYVIMKCYFKKRVLFQSNHKVRSIYHYLLLSYLLRSDCSAGFQCPCTLPTLNRKWINKN